MKADFPLQHDGLDEARYVVRWRKNLLKES